MTYAPRLLAPVQAPAPPKPPQLNIVASSLMPDVDTDSFGPGDEPSLTASGEPIFNVVEMVERGTWATRRIGGGQPADRPITVLDKLPGDDLYRETMERRNALVAAVGVMSDLELKQAEQALGVTPESLPSSVFPATSSRDRWQGGFAYAPENQSPGHLIDPCGNGTDLPYLQTGSLAAPTAATATGSITGGALAAGTYSYIVTATDPTGMQGAPTAAFTGNVASGTTGSVALAWTAPSGTVESYNIYGRTATAYTLIGNVTGTSFTDTGVAGPTLADQWGNLPQVGYIPFIIEASDISSTFGWEVRDWVGRALRLLDNQTPNAIEREFWTGAFATQTTTGPIYQSDFPDGLNAFLQQSATASNGGSGLLAQDLTPGTVPSVTRGIQILEDYLANTGFGGQGMIHVAPETSPNLLGARRIGSLLLSVMDNIIVPGSGYPTSGSTGPAGNANINPGAGNAWIFATDLCSVRLGEPVVYPMTMAEATDRGKFGQPNTTVIRAQRAAAITFDGARLAACRVALAS